MISKTYDNADNGYRIVKLRTASDRSPEQTALEIILTLHPSRILEYRLPNPVDLYTVSLSVSGDNGSLLNKAGIMKIGEGCCTTEYQFADDKSPFLRVILRLTGLNGGRAFLEQDDSRHLLIRCIDRETYNRLPKLPGTHTPIFDRIYADGVL